MTHRRPHSTLWPKFGIAALAVFVGASLWTTVSIQHVRKEFEVLVSALGALTRTQDTIHDLHVRTFHAPHEAEGKASAAAESLAEALQHLDLLSERGQNYVDIGAEVEATVEALRGRRSEILRAAAERDTAGLESALDRTYKDTSEAIRLLRRKTGVFSVHLWNRWNAAMVLLGLACALAAFAMWSFWRERRQSQALEEARAQLEESQRQLRMVISNSPIILWSIDAVGIVTLSLGKGLEALGFREGDLLGRSVFDMYADHPEIPGYLHRALAGETFDVRVRLGDVWLHSFYAPIRGANGRVAGVIGVTTDVSDLMHAEETLRHAEDVRREGERIEALGRLAGGIAHEFANLLTIMTGFGGLVRESLGPSHASQVDLERVLHAVDQATRLVREMLAFAHQPNHEPEIVDLNTVVERAIEMLVPVLGEDIHVELRLHPAPLLVLIDPGRLEQMIVNLALNARDALPDGGNLRLETCSWERPAAGRLASLRVVDQGSGMSEEVRSHAFEPFFTTKARGKGTGLGLATCQSIAIQAGGSIQIESEPGRGTTIEVLLPAREAQPARERAVPHGANPPRGSETLLLAEDDPMVRAFAMRVLTSLGYRVLEAEDGRRALELARSTEARVDLLVTDVVMPELGGVALARELTAHFPGLCVLFISGYSGGERLPGREGALARFLPKPFSAEELGRAVREALRVPGSPAAPARTPETTSTRTA